jgi:hypothetical protein
MTRHNTSRSDAAHQPADDISSLSRVTAVSGCRRRSELLPTVRRSDKKGRVTVCREHLWLTNGAKIIPIKPDTPEEKKDAKKVTMQSIGQLA